ncbi:MAG: hypothetical protein HY697_03490 [Deltaproteobacteria bacterium]|nr:hypothetical protein [Deltaproteobacteria bacterium]
MNGLFNMNFMMTFLLAKDLPENKDKFVMALAGAQSRNLLTPVLLKVGAIDKIKDLEEQIAALRTENAGLKEELAECQGAAPNTTKEVKSLLRKIHAKRTFQDLKNDEKLLGEIYALAGPDTAPSQAA